MKRIIYATETLPWMQGMVWRNARFFTAADGEADQVFVHGDHPRIVAAYKAKGVPVIVGGPEGLARQPVQLEPPPTELGRKKRRRPRRQGAAS